MQFVSSRAKVKCHLEGENIILGPSTVGEGTLVGRNVTVGYPTRKSLQSFVFPDNFSIEKLDKVSRGASIGDHCIVRSGSVVYENVSLGDYVETGHDVLIREGSEVGERTRIGSSAKLDGSVKVGKNVSIQSNVYLPHLTVVGDNVFLAPSVVVTNDPYPPSKRLIGIVIEKDAVIGANACVVARTRIGQGAVVAAGAVVTKNVLAHEVVMGAPARVVATRKEYDRKKTKWEDEMRT